MDIQIVFLLYLVILLDQERKVFTGVLDAVEGLEPLIETFGGDASVIRTAQGFVEATE